VPVIILFLVRRPQGKVTTGGGLNLTYSMYSSSSCSITRMPTTKDVNKNQEAEENKDNEQIQTIQLIGIVRPGEHDVLSGRGGLANNFSG
jgi:hypothetical protein